MSKYTMYLLITVVYFKTKMADYNVAEEDDCFPFTNLQSRLNIYCDLLADYCPHIKKLYCGRTNTRWQTPKCVIFA